MRISAATQRDREAGSDHTSTIAVLFRIASYNSGRSWTPMPRSELSSQASWPAALRACSIRAAAAALADEWLMKTLDIASALITQRARNAHGSPGGHGSGPKSGGASR